MFDIQVTVSDDDGDSDMKPSQAVVSGVRLDSTGTLQIVGTDERDNVKLRARQQGATIAVDYRFGSDDRQEIEFVAADVASVLVHL